MVSFRAEPRAPEGDHTRVKVWAGPDRDHRALAGEITLRNSEVDAFVGRVNDRVPNVSLRPDDPDHREQVLRLIDRHMVPILNGLRDGLSVSAISGILDVPVWLVERLGRDSGIIPRRIPPNHRPPLQSVKEP